MSPIPSITVLISGRGSNLEALHREASGYRVGAVISNRCDARGIDWAKEAGLTTHVLHRQLFPTARDFHTALLEVVMHTRPALVVLAGYMALLPPEFIAACPARIINIHPSLLPKYPGLDTHARALAAGELMHGCTAHFVDQGLDTGRVIAQVSVPIHPEDDADALAERTRLAEHSLYPWVVRHVVTGDITLADGHVRFSDDVRREALTFGYRLNTV